MPIYIALATYTDQGIRKVKDSPKRLDAARAMLRQMGGDFRHFWMTLGEYDLVFVYEAPDDAISARFLLQLGMLGNVRTKTLKAFPEPAYRELFGHLELGRLAKLASELIPRSAPARHWRAARSTSRTRQPAWLRPRWRLEWEGADGRSPSPYAE